MPDDLDQTVVDQDTEIQPGTQDEQTGTETAESIDENQDAQPQQGGSETDEGLGPDDLSPELHEQRKNLLRDYHRKLDSFKVQQSNLEKTAEQYKKEAETYQQLAGSDWPARWR